jgi:hypothetical protein
MNDINFCQNIKNKIPKKIELDSKLEKKEKDQTLIIKDHVFFKFGKNESLVWNLIDNKRTCEEIIEEIIKNVKYVPKDIITKEVLNFLKKLSERGLIKYE